MANLDIVRGRSTVLNLTNQSGAARSAGDLVVIDTANSESFKTSTTSNTTAFVGVVDEPIGVGSNGRVVVSGYARSIKTLATSVRGDFLYHSTTAATAAHMAGSAPQAGAFGEVLAGGSGTSSTGYIFPTIQAGSSLSIGSNSSAVSGASSLGAATTYAPSTHTHEGVYSITSSSSNTLERPTVNFRAGANVGITATDSNGNGVLDTVTISATATPSSGSASKSYVTKPGLRPPDSAGTGDIEFLSYANATDPTAGPGLSWGNQGSATGTVNSGALVMNSATPTGLRALLKATPGSGNFTVDTAVSAFFFENTHAANIVMLWGTPGTPTAIRGCGFYWDSGVATRTQYVWTTYNTSWAATADVASAASSIPAPTFLRVEWDGTNLVFKVSHSGLSGTFGQITSQALGLGRPDYIGVGVNNNGATTAAIAAFHFLRFGWTADFDPTTDN